MHPFLERFQKIDPELGAANHGTELTHLGATRLGVDIVGGRSTWSNVEADVAEASAPRSMAPSSAPRSLAPMPPRARAGVRVACGRLRCVFMHASVHLQGACESMCACAAFVCVHVMLACVCMHARTTSAVCFEKLWR
jgi:hypothetical protein